ncbi:MULTISPECIES: LysR substrate-binding domain-containing protein [unclassified Novosphingobium]|uniref:LysR substrate-binding domain-containing protein n=1 Tax=unclassified Novosphingobium TaxID=2644732 RepID=UPI0014946D90|nr:MULTISPECIES: LysR substrate-binding domain-containing protein [unclassified Novosphingobium]MBB3359683.1 LysR family glycine cleavage system transcriptional activator [Novosphingobium sp. BK256]MBB3375951.1 LysR family glycine cleavage system transcriptional activator [Novosphingobium sp. BK280]MBB3380456.1 LysR family glycine cleavage system transcriptional activator [Novosphingobium sp. BK258]MBB3422108.1 LysR family glycine cleavage system transcriptional activator [Novosphingobium sp. B
MIRRLPPLRSLEAFIRVVRAGSAKTAAAELALSPSALSRRLAALEEFVGKPLFERKHQALKLTEDGQTLYDAVAPLIDEMADRIDRMIDTGKVMRLRLGVLPLFGSQRLFPRLGELRKLHPQLHIDIDSSAAAETKLGDTIDAAIILSEGPDAALHAVRLDHNRVYAIASKQLAEELGNRPDMAKLAKQTFLVHNDLPASFEAWKRTLHLEALEPAAIDHFDSGQLILEAAAQGLGIAIMHDDHFSRSHDPRLARVYDIEVDSPYSYWFVCRPRALQSRPVRLFHDWMLKAGL